MAPAEALTVNEVVAFAGIEEGRVRKDVEKGLFGQDSPPKFDRVALVYFKVMAELGVQVSVEDRRRFFRLIGEALTTSPTPTVITLSPVLDLKLTRVTKEVRDTLRRFEAWRKKRVSTKPDVLGGEPAFAGTRLAVRHIGGLVLQDATDEIREDYPALSDEDIAFAKIYTLAYPKRGRPRIRRVPKSA